MPRPRSSVPATKFLVTLSGTLAIDLEAFCRTFLEAPRTEIIRRALKDYIREQLDRAPALREDFVKHKADLTTPLRLVTEEEGKKG